MKFWKKYDQLIFKEYKISEQGLALYRIFFAISALLVVGYPSITWMGQLSDYYYQPQPLNIAPLIFKEIPSDLILFLLSLLPSICLLAILLGYKTRYFALAFGLMILAGMSLKAGLGKIDHGILFPLTAIIMAFSGWDRKYSMVKNHRKQEGDGFPQFLVASIIALAMFGAGYLKWDASWLSDENVGVLHHYLSSYYGWERSSLLSPYLFNIRSIYIWNALDLATVLFEVLFVVAILRKSWFQKYLVVALLFHTLIFMILNITIVSIFLAYALFLPWDDIHKKVSEPLSKLSTIPGKPLQIALAVFIITVILGMTLFIYFIDQEETVTVLNWLSLICEWDYKWWQTVIVYVTAYLAVFGSHFK